MEQLIHEDVQTTKMGEFLQTCLTAEEIYSIVAKTILYLFPGDSGALFVFSSSRDLLNPVITWGKDLHENIDFHYNECWALRQGRVCAVSGLKDDLELTVRCQHVGDFKYSYLCAPMIAHSEVIGILHLCAGEQNDNVWVESRKRLIANIIEQISLSMINLKLREALRNLSIRDNLTGLFNRRYMEEAFEREKSIAERKKTSLGIIMLDIDYFKKINDTFGHGR